MVVCDNCSRFVGCVDGDENRLLNDQVGEKIDKIKLAVICTSQRIGEDFEIKLKNLVADDELSLVVEVLFIHVKKKDLESFNFEGLVKDLAGVVIVHCCQGIFNIITRPYFAYRQKGNIPIYIEPSIETFW